MKRNILILPFFIFVIGLCAQNNPTFKADVNIEAEEEIIKLEFYLASLIVSGDFETYSTYLTDDYIRINQNGTVATKEQVLEQFQSNTGKASMTPYDLEVRIYGDAAILNGKLDVETKNGDEIVRKSSLFTKIFIRRHGKWYLASLQGTPAR
jgi:hypothetical protein